MSIPAHAVRVEVTVPFSHCDPLQVVWHGRYFEYFEAARMVLLRSVALDVEPIAAMGYRMYITEVRCRYVSPLRYGHVAAVQAWFTAARPLIRIAYRIDNKTTGRACARAHTLLATTYGDALLPQTPDGIFSLLPVG
jgi:acyl-CoA thioester hydrolase